MKEYKAPALKAIKLMGEDIIQTSGESTVTSLPTTVVQGANGTTKTAQPYQSTGFESAYTSITD